MISFNRCKGIDRNRFQSFTHFLPSRMKSCWVWMSVTISYIQGRPINIDHVLTSLYWEGPCLCWRYNLRKKNTHHRTLHTHAWICIVITYQRIVHPAAFECVLWTNRFSISKQRSDTREHFRIYSSCCKWTTDRPSPLSLLWIGAQLSQLIAHHRWICCHKMLVQTSRIHKYVIILSINLCTHNEMNSLWQLGLLV